MNIDDLELIEQKLTMASRRNFYVFRRFLWPKQVTGWFQKEVCDHLQEWYEDLLKGERPILILNTPPQHGKSDIITSFAAWVMGKDPELKIIYAAFSDRLSIRANLRIQRILEMPKYKKVFPDTKLPSTGSRDETRSRSLVELIGHEGSFRNTTVRGSITGESLDFGIIDDPIKGREQANSELVRDTTWDWFTDDFFSRFSDEAGMIVIATRWHIDDPISRMIKKFDNAKLIKYQAIAEEDEPHRKAGEPLFPELKSKQFLDIRHNALSEESWQSLYQQNPVATGGNLIKTDRFKLYKTLPELKYIRVFIDTAYKAKEQNDRTAILVAAAGNDGNLYLLEMIKGRYEYPELKATVKNVFHKYRNIKMLGSYVPLRDLVVEDKASGISLIQELRRETQMPITSIERNRDKYNRWLDVEGYLPYVYIPEEGEWVLDFIEECKVFTGLGDTHDDQVDTLIDAMQMILVNATGLSVWENI